MSAENIRNTYRKQGAQSERERIIKLLEDNKGQKGLISVEYAQWLIKGENK